MNVEKILAKLSVSEALYFGEIFLGKTTLAQDAVEQALTVMVSNPLGVSRAQFFLKLEEVVSRIRTDETRGNDGQLELFKFEQTDGKQKKIEKEIKIARAQAYLGVVRSDDLELLKKMPISGNEKYRGVISGFCEFLREERNTKDNQHSNHLSQVEYEEMLSYLLELLPDNDAMEVERKCRQNTEWQVEKIWTSRVIGWIEDAVRRWEQLSVETDRSFESVREQRILNMIRSRNDHESTLTNGSEEVSEDTKRIDSPKMSKDIIKDKNILIWLSVGLLASLVGYFGWKERIDEIEENSSRTINESFEISVPSNDLIVDDNWSQVAMLAAQDSADRVLGEKLVKEIEKMEKEISISPKMLPAYGNDSEINEPENQAASAQIDKHNLLEILSAVKATFLCQGKNLSAG